MKKIITILIPLLLVGCVSVPYKVLDSSVSKHWKKPDIIKVAILPIILDEETEVDPTDALAVDLIKGGWVVVDKSMTNKIIEEQKFQNSGIVDKNSVEIGRLTGANVVLIGNTMSGEKSSVDSRLLDVQTGEVVATVSCSGKSSVGRCISRELIRLVNGLK